MRVVTIVQFGRQNPQGTEDPFPIYAGDAWLFRFEIQSPEHFFRSELPRLTEVFEIDPRSIYLLALYGAPGCGLYDVRLYISFKEPPDEGKLTLLRWAAPEREREDDPFDELNHRFLHFLKQATPAAKRKLARALQQEERHAIQANQSR